MSCQRGIRWFRGNVTELGVRFKSDAGHHNKYIITRNFMMYTYKATIINIVDGDTVDAIIDMGFKIHTTQRLRLNRIDTEEMHDANLEKRKLAIEAKEYLRNTLLNKEVIIETRKSDSFGRWLAEIVYEDININNVLLEKNLASLWKK